MIFVIKEGLLRGAQCRVVARSRRTGGMTVKLLQDFGAHRKDATVHVMPYEVEVRAPRYKTVDRP